MDLRPLTTLVLLVAGLALAAPAPAPARAQAGADGLEAARAPTPPAPQVERTLGPRRLDAASGRYVARLGDGQALLTLDPRLQKRLERTLAESAAPYAATVLLDPRSGRILAMAEYSREAPAKAEGLALKAIAPAASIFKIVTAAALLEQGWSPDQPVCYHGGERRLAPGLLEDDARRDRACLPLAVAFGHSTNVVFAKLADRGLSAELLRSEAQRFLFNGSLPFAFPVEPSRAVVPDDRFGLANTAAGFGDVRLSPLHAALLGAIVANRGVLVPPWLVELVDGGEPPPAQEPVRVVDESVADALGGMMRETVSSGTARRVFRRVGRELRGVTVAGKTGSLSEARPFRDHTWFVGYAPAEAPQVVVATVVVNGPLWRVRAPWVAKEALSAYFADQVAEAERHPQVRLARRAH